MSVPGRCRHHVQHQAEALCQICRRWPMAYDRLFVGYGQTVYVLVIPYISVCCKQFHSLLHTHHQLSGISLTHRSPFQKGVLQCRESPRTSASQPAPAR